MTKENPEEGQEVDIKYKITNAKGEILDHTEGRQTFKFIVGDTKTVMKCISDAVMTMKRNEKKTIEINTEEEPNMLDILGEEKKNLPENKTLKMEIELERFSNVSKSLFELTDTEKYDYAQNLKTEFIITYMKKDYQRSLDLIKQAASAIEAINKDNKTEEINKFYITLLLNVCNCMNNLKDYSNTVRVGKKAVEMDPNSIKAYYYMGNAYAYLDEFDEAKKCYDKLYELIANKTDPGVVALNNLITKRRTAKEENARRKYRAYLAQKDK